MKKVAFAVAAVSMMLSLGCGLGEVCVPTLTCAKGGSIQSCASAATAVYKASDGTNFPCTAASNCTSAAEQAVAWCNTH